MATFEESLAQLSAATLEESPEVGFEFFGVATNVIDTQQFYIVSLRCYRLMHILENPGELAEDIAQYSTVIYLSPTLKRHVRGIVQQVSSNKSCDINAMDYGITDMKVTPSNIFNLLRPEAGTIPGLAYLCHLSMCYPRGGAFSKEAIDAFKFFMGQTRERLTITIKEKNKYKLGVLVKSSQSNPDDVSTVMAYSNFSVYYPAPL